MKSATRQSCFIHPNTLFPLKYFPPTLKEKMESFWPKKFESGGTKIRPEIPSNFRIFESKWLAIES